MNKRFFILLFLAIAAYGQVQERVAIINTLDDLDSISITNLTYLTDRLRETAVNVLPSERFGIMTTESIVAFLGSMENTVRVCKESSCLAELGRQVSADYVAQGRIGRFNNNLTIKVELYNVNSGNLMGSFAGSSKDISGLLALIEEKASDLFKRMLAEKRVPAQFFGGIGGVQVKGTDYEFAGEKRYLASISSEPEGAGLSFNGVPNSRCAKTPCNVELGEGSVRIIAALEQYEIADTTVSIKQNNQSVKIRLKANFGVLEIKPAYSDGIGRDEQWSLAINGKAASSWENRLSPNKYKVELSHGCYEAISFEAGINRDKREVFDMASHIKLRKGGLVLSAEQDGEPVSNPVFVNGIQVGETPFSGTVPLCAKIEIGDGRETVDVKLKYEENVKYVHKLQTRKSVYAEEPQYEGYKAPKDESFIRLGARWRGGFFSPDRWIPVIGGPGYLTPGLTLNIRITDMINLASEFNYSLLFYKHVYQTIEVPALLKLMLLNKDRGDGIYAETGFQWGFPVSYKATRVERDQGLVFGFGFRLFDYSIGIWSIGMRLTYPLTKLDKDGTDAPIIMSILTLAYDFF